MREVLSRVWSREDAKDASNPSLSPERRAEVMVERAKRSTVDSLISGLMHAKFKLGPGRNAATAFGGTITLQSGFFAIGNDMTTTLIHEAFHLHFDGGPGFDDIDIANALNLPHKVVPGDPQQTMENASAALGQTVAGSLWTPILIGG